MQKEMPMLAKILLAFLTLTLTLMALRKFASLNQAARVKVRRDNRPVDRQRNAVALRQDPKTGVWRED
jgi:hypothetical protein